MKLLFFTFLVFLTVSCSLTSKQNNLIGQKAPDPSYYLLDGGTHILSEQLGKTVVLIFWDASCYHCLQTLPEINDLAKKYRKRSDIYFLAISINRQSDESKLKSRIDELGLSSMQHAFSGNDVYDESFMAFNGESVPYLILINKSGVVKWIGRDAGELEEELK